MSEHHHHHHSHHHDDYATRFTRRGLRSIVFRRKFEKWLIIGLFALALLMILLVLAAYLFG